MFGIEPPGAAAPPGASAWKQENADGLAALRAAISQTGLSGPAAEARKRLIGAGRAVSAALQAGDAASASAALRGAAGDLRAVGNAGASAPPGARPGTGLAAAPVRDTGPTAGGTASPVPPQAGPAAPAANAGAILNGMAQADRALAAERQGPQVRMADATGFVPFQAPQPPVASPPAGGPPGAPAAGPATRLAGRAAAAALAPEGSVAVLGTGAALAPALAGGGVAYLMAGQHKAMLDSMLFVPGPGGGRWVRSPPMPYAGLPPPDAPQAAAQPAPAPDAAPDDDDDPAMTPEEQAARDRCEVKPVFPSGTTRDGQPVGAAELANPRPDSSYVMNGYAVRTNRLGRPDAAEGDLHFGEGGRIRPRRDQVPGMRPDADAGGPDDRGHGVARRFEGPGDLINLVAQNANLNRGALRALDDRLAQYLRDCRKVHFREEIIYAPGSQRPVGFVISFSVDGGNPVVREFYNERGGVPRAQ